MKITAILNTHGLPELTLDTLESIKCHMTDRIVLTVNGTAWKSYENYEISCDKLKGFNNCLYRNIILGLLTAANKWITDTDWFCYLEYDCLVGSSLFKKDLELLEKDGIWLAGNDARRNQYVDFRLLEKIVGVKFNEVSYMLGACVFYHKDFVKLLLEQEILERLLYYTNDFHGNFFPYYGGHDLTEHAIPTIVEHLGGKVHQFASYKDWGLWTGNYRKYPIRYVVELPFEHQNYLQASIMHPIKNLSHPIRQFHQMKRTLRRNYDT
jgi:hypothetical protein